MANTSGLIPFNERTPEEAREVRAKGAIVRGKKIRKRKAIAETIDAILREVTPAGTTKQEAMVAKCLEKAFKEGSIKALKMIVEILGEMPAQRHEVTGAEGRPLVPSSEFDLSKLSDEQRAVLLSIGEQAVNDTEH